MRLVIASLIPALTLAAAALPAAAQDIGGMSLALQGGMSGYALQTPRSGAAQIQSMLGATDRRSQHQAQIARLRGDAGYLGGFSFGKPLSPSVQPGQGFGAYGDQGPPVVVNNFDGPVVLGNGNVVQQQTAISTGPIAQQQVASRAGGGGGAANVITSDGRIVQAAPGLLQSRSARRPQP
jgi:hypothetical protein